MALGNTPRTETNFAVEASKSYAFGIRFLRTDKSYVDMTKVEVRLVISESAYRGGSELVVATASPIHPRSGTVQFRLQAEDLALNPGSYPYDITLIPASGYSTPILKGVFEVGSNADVDASNIYAHVQSGSDITAVLDDSDLIEITIENIDGLYTLAENMISDFTTKVEADVAITKAQAAAAEASAILSADYARELREWLSSVGYPFWQGTMAQYSAIGTPVPHILYLIVDDPALGGNTP